jgi:hypothetical protein
MDQARPEVQRGMAEAWHYVMANSDFVSRKLGPQTTWLEAFQQYAAAANATGAGGDVPREAFYPLLGHFLQDIVRD